MNHLLTEEERKEVASFRPLRDRFGAVVAVLGMIGLIVMLIVAQVVEPTTPKTVTSMPSVVNGVLKLVPVVPSDPSMVQVNDRQRTVTEQTVVVMAKIGNRRGSGFLVHSGVVVTAAHIGDDDGCEGFRVTCDGKTVEGNLIAADPERDVAVIEAAGCEAEPLQLDDSPLDVNDRLVVSGYNFPHGEPQQFIVTSSPIPGATISGTVDDQAGSHENRAEQIIGAGTELHAIAGLLNPGNSGSPVFRDDGSIVGIVSIGDTKRNRTFIVVASEISYVLLAAGLD